jgi:hypothetical protein
MVDANDASGFLKKCNVGSTPFCILVDPKGRIVKAGAPPPHDPRLADLLEEQNL